MDTLLKPRVAMVDRIQGGLVISFTDNRNAMYPESFLYASISQVQELHDIDLDSEEKAVSSRDEVAAINLPITACELMRMLASPLEVLANLTFLALEDAISVEKVRRYMQMAEDQMTMIGEIMRATFTAEANRQREFSSGEIEGR